MAKSCSSCGAMAAPEARFCRLCGAPLRPEEPGEGFVSPMAQTVPLSGEGRHTDGFTPGDPKRSPDTSRVGRDEIERLLHRTPAEPEHSTVEPARSTAEPAPDEAPDDFVIIPVSSYPGKASDFIAPDTSELPPAPAPKALGEPQETTAQEQSTRLAPARRPGVAPARHGRSRRFRIGLAVCAALLLFAVLAVASVAFYVSRRRAVSEQNAASASRPGAVNSQGSLDEQLAEARALLGAGETEAALARLRSLVQREPSNARVHKLLADALFRSGAREEALAEYREATRLDPDDTAAWQALASVQFADGRYQESVESYRRLTALVGDDGIDDNGRLEYADALRLAGYTEEARALYRKLEVHAPADLASQATHRLSELAQAKPSPSPSITEQARAAESPARDARAELARSRPAELPSPAPLSNASPSPPPQQQQQSAPASSSSSPVPSQQSKSTVAQSDPDAYYFQALSIVNGRDPKNLPRPELLRALQLFQNAANSARGAHRDEARRYAERLGREFDRRPRER